MEYFGVATILLIFLCIKKVSNLFYLLLFMSFFTGTSAINIGSFSLPPVYLVLIFLILRLMFLKNRIIVLPNKLITIFFFFITISLSMPILLENRVLVLSIDDSWEYLKFTTSNVTQYMYILLSLLTYLITKKLTREKKIDDNEVIKVMGIATIILGLLSIYQLIAYVYKLPYDEIFRNSIHRNVQPYGLFTRVYGVSGEPSMHAINVLFLLSFNLFLNKKRWWVIFLIFLSGLLSTSTTFTFGIVIIFFIFLNRFIVKKKKVKEILIGLIIISLIIIMFNLLTLKYPIIKGFYSTEIIEKLQGNNKSGSIRKDTMIKHLILALEYPFFGVGFGSIRTKDLLTTWASSIGIFGFASFSVYIYKLRKVNKDYLYIPLALCLILELISVPEPYYLYLWIFMGIIEEKMIEKKKYEKSTYINHSKICNL